MELFSFVFILTFWVVATILYVENVVHFICSAKDGRNFYLNMVRIFGMNFPLLGIVLGMIEPL